MVAYDYSLAAILNLVISLPGVEHTYWSGYIMSAMFAIMTVILSIVSKLCGTSCVSTLPATRSEQDEIKDYSIKLTTAAVENEKYSM